MNILITGGAGFIGSHLTEKLIAKGYSVTIVDSFTNFSTGDFKLNLDYRKKLIKGAKLIKSSASNQLVWKDKYTILVHLAAIPIVNPKYGDFFKVNVWETDKVLKQALNNDIRRVLFPSSIYVYGSYRGRSYEEDFPLEPEDNYGLSKAFGEYLVRKYFLNREWIIVRTAGVFGFGDHNWRVSQRIIEKNHNMFSLEISKETKRSFIYIDDLVDGLVKVIETPVNNEVFNMTGDTILLEEFAKESREYLPGLSWNLRDKPKNETVIGPASTKKAQQLLGFQIKYSIRDGIKKYIQVMQRNLG